MSFLFHFQDDFKATNESDLCLQLQYSVAKKMNTNQCVYLKLW